MDLLVTQCHGMLQQYVDNMQQMIHHTIAAAMQLGIRPLTDRVDPDTLAGPSPVIAQALLREFPERDPRWRQRCLVAHLPLPCGRVLLGVRLLLPCFLFSFVAVLS